MTNVQKITNLYLYGQEATPSNLVDDSLIRPENVDEPVFTVNKSDFMITGAGRFANGAQFDFIGEFFDSSSRPESTSLQPGTYTKQQIAEELFGYSFYGWNMNQYDFRDGTDDYIERTYIYNTMSFKISDSSVFIVASDGSRSIENFYVESNDTTDAPENFDLVGGNIFTNIINVGLGAHIDPSSIGRKVKI